MKLGCMLVNHNNGTGSRISDCSKWPQIAKPEPDNFLEICLDSYFRSIQTDSPLIIVDDGSTDNSPEIIHRYHGRYAQFIRKDQNEGLNRGMNEAADILINKFDCDIICRFDADIEFLTSGWDVRFIKYFESDRKVAAVGACQLLPFGAIWSLGDMLIHPDGYTHLFGVKEYLKPLEQLSVPPVMATPYLPIGNVECDSVMGCLAAFRSTAFQRVGGLRQEFDKLRGQTEDLNLRLLLEGYRIMALGSIIFLHRHMEHAPKTADSDSTERRDLSISTWEELWGWNKLSPDLNAIYDKWQDTPLVRNLVKGPDGQVMYIGPG